MIQKIEKSIIQETRAAIKEKKKLLISDHIFLDSGHDNLSE